MTGTTFSTSPPPSVASIFRLFGSKPRIERALQFVPDTGGRKEREVMSTDNKRPTLVKAEKYGDAELIRSAFSACRLSVACCKYVMSVLIRVVNPSLVVALSCYDILAINSTIGFNKKVLIRFMCQRDLGFISRRLSAVSCY